MRPEHVTKSPILASLTVCGGPGALPGTPGEACIVFVGRGQPQARLVWVSLNCLCRREQRLSGRASQPSGKLSYVTLILQGLTASATPRAAFKGLSCRCHFEQIPPRSSTSANAATPADSPGRRRPAIPAQHPSNGDRATVDATGTTTIKPSKRGGAPFLLHPNLKTGYPRPWPLLS